MSNGSAGKREHYRLDIQIPIWYRYGIEKEDGTYAMSEPFKGVGINYSGGGGAFRIQHPLEPKVLVLIDIFFPFTRDPITVLGEVVRTKEETVNDRQIYLAYVNYICVDPTDQDNMIGFLISKGTEIGKKQEAGGGGAQPAKNP
jgi:hypothetical protein